MSLDENLSSGNPADARARIVALPSPSPTLRLFWCRLDPVPRDVETLGATLSPYEWTRAGRFGKAALRERYIVGRGLLRTIIGDALGMEPARVEIVRGRRGRPQLAPPHALDFNISHTLAVALVGLIEGARIGVDVEHAGRSINAPGIARKFMTANERRALESLPADTARRRVQIVTGPKVTIEAPIANDSVSQGIAMSVRVHVTHPDGVRADTARPSGV